MSTTLALESSDGNLTVYGLTTRKINDVTAIGSMRNEVSFGMTGRTFLQSMGIRFHKGRK